MDFAQVGVELSREEELISTKKRLESFQFRRTGITVPASPLSPASSIGRSHSRHGSVSSVSLSGSISTISLGVGIEQPSMSSSDSRPSSFVGRPRPTSHHRRRSSVSTRAESAEMMGITLPELPASSSEDNINFGDKDSVRRRALQALEGRNDLGLYNNTVEIPEFTAQGVPQKPFDREFKLPANGLSFGLTSLPGKRDSFGKFISSTSSLKDQLHTLMEEEEEDEEETTQGKNERNVQSTVDCSSELTPNCEEKPVGSGSERRNVAELSAGIAEVCASSSAPAASGTGRSRPANLTLRPLSLVSSVSSPNLPTPSVTPNLRPGIRSFPSVSQPDMSSNSSSESCDTRRLSHIWKQNTDMHSNSSSLSSTTSSHQSSSGSNPKRQSSISYIRSGPNQLQPTTFTFASLPTPGATPTSERRQSTSSVSSFGSFSNQDRRNMSDDMFLQQSHASLLARIAELEHALQCRSRSRSISLHLDDSTDPSEPPDDRLVADLKVERDELNRDIEGWRQRVKDLEHAKTSLGHEKFALERRLEAERREGWIKDEKLNLLETEKGTLNRQLVIKEEDITSISRRLESTQAQLRQARLECDSLREDADVSKRQLMEAQRLLEARKGAEAELRRVQEALRAEQLYREKLISQLDAAGVLETPRVTDRTSSGAARYIGFIEQSRSSGLGFQSIDSACTTVAADEENHKALSAPFTLKAVEEESEVHDEYISDEEDELACYEEEDDLVVDFTSPARSMASSSSEDDFPRSLSHLRLAANSTPVPSSDGVMMSKSPSSTPSPTSSPCPTPIPPLTFEVRDSSHASQASLSKTWTFPRGDQPPSLRLSRQEVDRFFGCLDDVDTSPPVGSCPSMDDRSIFSQRLQLEGADDEDLPPFVLPTQKVTGVGNGRLDVILEEGNESECDGASGRRKISLPISVNEESLSGISSPLMDDLLRTSSLPFVFPPTSTHGNMLQSINASPSVRNSEVIQAKGPCDTVNNYPSDQKVANPQPNRPSRIPPPSPPRFFQAKTASPRGTFSTPCKNNASTQAANAFPASPSRLKPLGAPVISPRGVKKTVPLSTHGSTFIPQLKVTTQKPRSGQ